jgi:2-C-methyl-D-erythritol 4-phosphate cytidylyltransferase/2-C-methyl-D-erythritol 2,4-cyclodiphosphate synthase
MADRQMKVAAIVLASGRGVRAGGDVPKQYQLLAGEPVLRHSLRTLSSHPRVDLVLAVISPEDRDRYYEAAAELEIKYPVMGGATRQESARLGLEALAKHGFDFVLIHDAARPLIPPEVIDRVLNCLEEGAEAAVPVLPLVDTIKEVSGQIGEHIEATLDRTRLRRAQTPQGCLFKGILAYHRMAAERGDVVTDDAALAQLYEDYPVRPVLGDERLMKITSPGDLARLERWFLPTETRTGTGFDVHRFEPGRRLVLCGLEIPHAQGLAGHSDADVGIHALCDAIYGALAEGDIGAHFPPSEAEWKDADSTRFLQHAAGRIAARGGRLVNADVTLICEAPRIRPHVEAMRARLAALLGVSTDRVGVKATTTERLGFTGRGEGIAAQAAVSVSLPAG